jgi:hypothetical protein
MAAGGHLGLANHGSGAATENETVQENEDRNGPIGNPLVKGSAYQTGTRQSPQA